MKLRILKLTPEELIRAIQGNPAQLNLPADLELVDIKYDVFNKQVTTVIRSDTFENVTENMPIPELVLTQKTTVTPTEVPAPTPEPVEAPKAPALSPPAATAPQKSLIQTLTASTQQGNAPSRGTGVKTLGPKPESNQDTCGFEEEFTKDQRKLLRFVSDGDYVIVKPIQFLKTEWEDINDTVKSIGGKWVKGSIIDYWAIPKNQTTDE
jgi:hypothetical protein